ncbi:c-type cytochrome [Aliiglaciecola sp. 3_MG-2023]|uniref:c-type cytochrome n=1 Tax=Aliiglaciecola sp. 3_MG-2023 TaxID=3062644 RepID=UPI0026E18907|nr:c-type cytochrome [Aliiglaciecola sp. 3_MG-2023]MDO6692007.1 c-type cytochrome [Aliiglaciecola sp. 3_MG-2023]
MNGILWLLLFSIGGSSTAFAERVYEKQNPPRELTAEQATVAASNYQKYCSLCHGDDREGHKNDHAPSLRSKSLFESGVPHSILRPMSYGRHGTAMGGYLDEVGGPMTLDETWDLTYWLFWQSGAQRVKLSEEPVYGDIAKGEALYQQNCTTCHGENGEGVTAPALFNPSFLAHNKDEFIRYAIEKGREDTPMQGFSDRLSETDIDNVTAFIRSKASEAEINKVPLKAIPTPDQYVINPDGEDPRLQLDQGKYVSSKDLHAAMLAKKRMVLIDTRVTSVWQRAHLAGSVPFPYYTDVQERVGDMPKDVLIVGYCSCPRAAAEHVMDQFNQAGYNNTAVLYEGIFGWMNLGYPVVRAEGLEKPEEISASH